MKITSADYVGTDAEEVEKHLGNGIELDYWGCAFAKVKNTKTNEFMSDTKSIILMTNEKGEKFFVMLNQKQFRLLVADAYVAEQKSKMLYENLGDTN